MQQARHSQAWIRGKYGNTLLKFSGPPLPPRDDGFFSGSVLKFDWFWLRLWMGCWASLSIQYVVEKWRNSHSSRGRAAGFSLTPCMTIESVNLSSLCVACCTTSTQLRPPAAAPRSQDPLLYSHFPIHLHLQSPIRPATSRNHLQPILAAALSPAFKSHTCTILHDGCGAGPGV